MNDVVPGAPPPPKPQWRAPRILLRAVCVVLFVWLASDFLVPIALGAVFAVLLFPWNRQLGVRLGRFKNYGPLLLTVAAFAFVIIPLGFIAAEAVNSVGELIRENPTASEEVERNAAKKLIPVARDLHIEAGRVREALRDLSDRVTAYAAGVVTQTATHLPDYLIDLFLFTIALYYFLRDGRRVASWLIRIVPFRRVETAELYASIRDTIHGAILGTIATALVQGALMLIALLVLGVPGAFFFAIIAAILSFTPVVGTAPVTIGAVVYLLLQQRWIAAAAMFAAGVLVGASDNIVRPWVTSVKGNMHPLLGLVSIFGGIQVFGPAGIFLGPVVGAMALWALDTYRTGQGLLNPHRAHE